MLEVLSDCRTALRAGSAAITQTPLCVQTLFDSIKYNTGSSNLHVSIQVPHNGSSVVLLWIEVHLEWLFFALQSMLERSRYPFFWCIEAAEAILLTHTSFPWHGQLAVGAQHLYSPVRGQASCSQFKGSTEYLVTGKEL